MLRHLSIRLFLLIALMTMVAFGALGYALVLEHTRHLEHGVIQSAIRLSDTIKRGTRHSMLQNRKEDVYRMIRDVADQEGMERIRIFNKEGLITFSTDRAEAGATVNKQAEACTACHARDLPLERLDRPDRARIFATPDRGRVLGLIDPIYNEADCASQACHAHPEAQKVLGVIDIQMSLRAIDRELAEQGRRMMLFTYLAMLFIASASGLFLYRFVHRPVKGLMEGMRRVASGDLSHRIAEGSQDEIGALAAAFNRMAEDLGQANEKLMQWGRTLEQRVEEKTRIIQQAQARVVHNEKMASLGALSAVVAHEVNNPLSGVLTYARLVRKKLRRIAGEGPEAAEMDRYLAAIESETARCGNIVKNLLAFSRQSPTSVQEVEVNRIVEKTLFLIGHKLELQRIAVTRKIAEGLPGVVCDADQVQQALLALLNNAVEAMPEGGGIRITTRRKETPPPSPPPEGEGREQLAPLHPTCRSHEVATRRPPSGKGDGGLGLVPPSGGWVEIVVEDTGCGIPEEAMPRLFEPFFTTKEGKGGLGLGLSVVYGIIKRHQGAIDVVSEVGKGTRVTVGLPGGVAINDERGTEKQRGTRNAER